MKHPICIFLIVLILISCDKPKNNMNKNDIINGQINNKLGFILCDKSDEPIESINRYQPLASYIAQQVTEYGYTYGDVKVSLDLEDVSSWLLNGEADLYMDSPYQVLLVKEKSGAIPILKQWKSGVENYHSVFFSKKNSDIDSISKMIGNVIALEDSLSTTGYLLPLGFLILEDLNIVNLNNSENRIDRTKDIGWLFAMEDQTIVQWVLEDKVDIGVLGSNDFEELPSDIKDRLQVIVRTPSIPRQLVLIRSDIDKNLRSKIINILIDMESSADGKVILENIKNTVRFEKLESIEATESIEYLNTLYRALESM